MALTSRSKLILLVLGLVATVALISVGALFRPSDEPGAAIEISGPIPPLSGDSFDGQTVTPAQYRGKAVVVNFWASWCGPCRKEQPALSRLWERYRGSGVQFIGVDFMDDRAAGRAYLEEFEVAYPSIEDRTGIVAHRFGIPYLPATVLVDASGEMRVRLVGAQTEADLERHLESLLQETGPG